MDAGSKRFFDGTHRVMAPEATLARLEPLKGAMGITRVANVTGLDVVGVPVVMVTRPDARSLAVSQGKGTSLPAAKASGLMESIELYHAERVTGPLLLDTYASLRQRHNVVDVDALSPHPAGRFHADLPILWMEGFELMCQQSLWLPHEAVHTDFTDRTQHFGGCFHNSSNGLASGNHLLEAIAHGICEVIERDAHWQWVAADNEHASSTRIDPAAVDDRGCQSLFAACRQADLHFGLWDMTGSHGVASIYAMVAGPAGDASRWLYSSAGSGSHAVREVAVQRALTEALQSRLTLISGSRDDLPHAAYAQVCDPRVVAHDLALLATSGFGACYADIPSQHFDSFHDDICWYLARLRTAGLHRVIVVNLTDPQFDVPVVRVVIPHTRIVTT